MFGSPNFKSLVSVLLTAALLLTAPICTPNPSNPPASSWSKARSVGGGARSVLEQREKDGGAAGFYSSLLSTSSRGLLSRAPSSVAATAGFYSSLLSRSSRGPRALVRGRYPSCPRGVADDLEEEGGVLGPALRLLHPAPHGRHALLGGPLIPPPWLTSCCCRLHLRGRPWRACLRCRCFDGRCGAGGASGRGGRRCASD